MTDLRSVASHQQRARDSSSKRETLSNETAWSLQCISCSQFYRARYCQSNSLRSPPALSERKWMSSLFELSCRHIDLARGHKKWQTAKIRGSEISEIVLLQRRHHKHEIKDWTILDNRSPVTFVTNYISNIAKPRTMSFFKYIFKCNDISSTKFRKKKCKK